MQGLEVGYVYIYLSLNLLKLYFDLYMQLSWNLCYSTNELNEVYFALRGKKFNVINPFIVRRLKNASTKSDYIFQ